MYRTLVILRHTFIESVLQPIYSLLLVLGAVVLLIFAALPFFTLGEDTTMFKTVALDVILLFVLVATLFATSKSIYEEIEGWDGSTRGAQSWADLPARAVKYVRRIEELIRCPVALVSTSPERDDTILVRDPFAS